MLITLNRKSLEAALVKMSRAGRVVMRMIPSRRRHCYPVQQQAHRPRGPAHRPRGPAHRPRGKGRCTAEYPVPVTVASAMRKGSAISETDGTGCRVIRRSPRDGLPGTHPSRETLWDLSTARYPEVGGVSPNVSGTKPAPATRNFGVIPRGDDVGAGAQDQMKVIGEDAEPEQVDAELSGQAAEVVFDPDFAVVVILSGDRGVADENAVSDDSVHDMHDCDFVVGENFRPSESSHIRDPQQSRCTKATAQALSRTSVRVSATLVARSSTATSESRSKPLGLCPQPSPRRRYSDCTSIVNGTVSGSPSASTTRAVILLME